MGCYPHVCWFLIILFNTTALCWAEADYRPLHFKEALEIAFAHNPQMVEARQARIASKGKAITIGSLKNPELDLEISRGNLETIGVKQPLDPIGVRFLESKMASNEIKIQDEQLRRTWALVYQKVRDSYSHLILDKKRLELVEDNLNTMRQFFGRVQQRYQSGQVFKNDFQRAKIELLQAEYAYLALEKELKINKAQLNLLLARPMETNVEVQEILQEERLQLSIEQLKILALANRPDIKMANLELDSKGQDVIKQQLNRLPSYSVGFQKTNKEYDKGYAFMVGVSIPLWNLNQGEVIRAKAAKAAQLVRSQAVKNEALFDVYQSYLEAEVAQKQFELSKKSLEEGYELLRLANLRYSEGRIDFLNYLDQVKTSAQAKINYHEALFNLSRSMSALETAVYASLRQEGFFHEKL